MKQNWYLIAISFLLIAVSVFLVCFFVAHMRQENSDLRKENWELKKSYMEKEIEIAHWKKELSVQKELVAVKQAAAEKKTAELERKLQSSIPLEVVMTSSENYSYRLPAELIERWLKLNALPEKPNVRDLQTFLAKLKKIIHVLRSSSLIQQKVTEYLLPYRKDLMELLLLERRSSFDFLITSFVQNMEKAELKKYLQKSVGTGHYYIFSNRFSRFADQSDKDWILQQFWTDNNARSLAMKYGYYKELLPEIKKRIYANPEQNLSFIVMIRDDIPQDELYRLTDQIWKKVRSNPNSHYMAVSQPFLIMLELGNVSYFEELGIGMLSLGAYNLEARRWLAKVSPVPLNELKNWIIKHKGNIVFDRKTKKFTAGNRKDDRK